jgi:NADH:ubiquinone oxidoreductase subunit 6 (subunit J)
VLLADIGFVGTLLLFLIFSALVVLWIFVLIDLFRREDLKWWHKALWLLLILILPFFGALIYIAARPVLQEDIELQQEISNQRDYSKAAKTTDQLHTLSVLRDSGQISEEKFEKKKAKILAKM